MRHLFKELGRTFPFLARFLNAIERDMAEQDAEMERHWQDALKRHDALREEAAERRKSIRLGGRGLSERTGFARDREALRGDWEKVIPPKWPQEE